MANKLIEPSVPRSDESEGSTGPVAPIQEQTIREPLGGIGEETVRNLSGDDTSLLVAGDATLTYNDVVKKTVAQLLVMSGDEAGTVIPLIDKEYLIGRQRDNQIQLNDLGISSNHARIFRGPEGYVVEDLKSRNGTWLNGTRVFHSILRDADEIRVGSTDLRYEILIDAAKTAGKT